MLSLSPRPSGAGLEHLDVRHTRLGLPQHLPTTLTSLRIPHTSNFALSSADVDRLLSLPRLAELKIGSTGLTLADLKRAAKAPG